MALRSLPALLKEAEIEHLSTVLADCTLEGLQRELKQSRVALLARLKELGVTKLGDRQKLANALSKAERLGNSEPYLDEKAAIAAAEAAAPHQSNDSGRGWLEKAEMLKQRGNEAFKAQRNKEAVDAWTDALHAASKAAQGDSKADNETLGDTIVKIKSNMAAAYLRMEQWKEARACADSVLQVEPKNAKALFRRGVARTNLNDTAGAKKDLLQCIKLDPKNKEARETLKALGVKEREPALPTSQIHSQDSHSGVEHISTETMYKESEWKQMKSGGG